MFAQKRNKFCGGHKIKQNIYFGCVFKFFVTLSVIYTFIYVFYASKYLHTTMWYILLVFPQRDSNDVVALKSTPSSFHYTSCTSCTVLKRKVNPTMKGIDHRKLYIALVVQWSRALDTVHVVVQECHRSKGSNPVKERTKMCLRKF